MDPLSSYLDASWEPLPAQTAPPVDHRSEPSQNNIAVIVCHGMGQQVRFQTINDMVQLVRDEAWRHDDVVRVVTRLVLFRDANGVCTDQLGRAEMTLVRTDGTERVVHFFEAYWAPLTEGKVVIRDVLWFLLRAGWNGLIAGARGFRRLMFGSWVDLPKSPLTGIKFLFALLVVASLVVINSAIGAVIAAGMFGWGSNGWTDSTIVNALVRDVERAEIVAVPLAISIWLVYLHRNWFLRRYRMAGRRWRLPKAVELFLNAWVWVALIVTVITGARVIYEALTVRGTSPPGPLPSNWRFMVVASISFGLSYLIRTFLIQYFGDVVIYISGHAVSKFNEIRAQIQQVGIKVGRAVYTDSQYARCILVGHSLGSVVAYDLFNFLVNEDDGRWHVRERTALLLTFGSPLDKTAFVFRTQQEKEADVREALVAAIQPIIVDVRNRPTRWINIWSPQDWISGELNYYEEPGKPFVVNIMDPDATIPLIAHTEYWKNLELGRVIYSAI